MGKCDPSSAVRLTCNIHFIEITDKTAICRVVSSEYQISTQIRNGYWKFAISNTIDIQDDSFITTGNGQVIPAPSGDLCPGFQLMHGTIVAGQLDAHLLAHNPYRQVCRITCPIRDD